MRISAAEKILLGQQLNLWWVEPCIRCRRKAPVDHLDERGGWCEECVEAIAQTGEER